MNLSHLQPGDEVQVNIRGREFPARVTGKAAGNSIPIEPTVPTISYRSARRSQIRRLLRSTQLQLEAM